MNEIEVIDGIRGEWRTVTKPEEVTVGQRVRYERNSKYGYDVAHIISKISDGKVDTNGDGFDFDIFNGYWKIIQAFYPLPVKQKRKVAKVEIIETLSLRWFVKINLGEFEAERHKYYSNKKSAIRGASRFCKAIGRECEIVKG
jgi:hypothetical protein